MLYRDIIDYFTNIAEKHKKIQQIYHGDFEEIISAQRDRILYPCLWLESPEALFYGDIDSKHRDWTITFVVFKNARPEDKAKIQSNIDETEIIALQVLSRIFKDWQEDDEDDEGNEYIHQVTFDSINMELVYSDTPDNDQGWRVTMKIRTKTKYLCYDQNDWNA